MNSEKEVVYEASCRKKNVNVYFCTCRIFLKYCACLINLILNNKTSSLKE